MNRILAFALICVMLLFSFYSLNAQGNSSINNDLTTKNLSTTWTVPLTIIGGGMTLTRTFGGDLNATNEFDIGIDVPAAPSGFDYYAYFEIAQFPNYLDTDIRPWIEPYETDIDWSLKVVNATGKTSFVSWDPAILPSVGTFTVEGTGEPIDMRTQDSLVFNGDKVLMIKYEGGTSVKFPVNNQPYAYQLFQNYPNPFNPKTTIKFHIPKTTFVVLKIFDTLGCEIYRLVDSKIPSGVYEYVWDGRNCKGIEVASGVYLYQIQSRDFLKLKKMILIR